MANLGTGTVGAGRRVVKRCRVCSWPLGAGGRCWSRVCYRTERGPFRIAQERRDRGGAVLVATLALAGAWVAFLAGHAAVRPW